MSHPRNAVADGSKHRRGAKELGAYYTSAEVADFLVWWAIRSDRDTVMDPSFGGGVFLDSACLRLAGLGARQADRVFGVEIDAGMHEATLRRLSESIEIDRAKFLRADFFDLENGTLPRVTAIVGNPPFIRYQRFAGDSRKRALAATAGHGVRLSELSSSWAPFLIHAIGAIEPGGRLGMVIPAEIGHAAYARPVLAHLAKSFRCVSFLTFRRRLFPELSEDTLLLLAEDKGRHPSSFLWRDLSDASQLDAIRKDGRLPIARTRAIDATALSRGRARLIENFIPAKARDLYRRLKDSALALRLGEFADVGIGYVTGANDFFHLHPDRARHWDIPEEFLRPAVRRGRALSGLRFTTEDWHSAIEGGEAGLLLSMRPGDDLTAGLRRYLEQGEAAGVQRAYKCRTRSPWYCVPHVYRPDAFLSYMSGAAPRLVANEAGAVAPNSLHILRLHPHGAVTSLALATLWQTSLTRLSVELEGHPLGGGMLKLEPTEAENVLIASPPARGEVAPDFAAELDALRRSGRDDAAQSRADDLILRGGLGLSESDCRLLRRAADTLRERRSLRSASA